MEENYFLRVKKLSPTRFWVNNPTPVEAVEAINAGAISCTTNPTYSMNQILREEEKENIFRVIDEVIKEIKDDNLAADIIQQKLVKRIMDKFLPIYEKNPNKKDLYLYKGILY